MGSMTLFFVVTLELVETIGGSSGIWAQDLSQRFEK